VDFSDRDQIFGNSIIFENDYLASNGELVGQNKLIYRINGLYYKEVEAWKVILSITLCGTDEIGLTPERVTNNKGDIRSPDVEKLVSSFRPSASDLKAFNLKDGENDLVYEYHIRETVLEKVSVKIFMFKSSEKLIISDIDGTITK
jgi:LNS2 (Lipin/Ned1/Smp2)